MEGWVWTWRAAQGRLQLSVCTTSPTGKILTCVFSDIFWIPEEHSRLWDDCSLPQNQLSSTQWSLRTHWELFFIFSSFQLYETLVGDVIIPHDSCSSNLPQVSPGWAAFS